MSSERITDCLRNHIEGKFNREEMTDKYVAINKYKPLRKYF